MLNKFQMINYPEGWEKKYGKYNDAPPNFKEITQKEFAQSIFFIYSPEYVEFKQIHPSQISPEEPYYLDVRLYYYFDGNGYGIANNQVKGKVRYFRFTTCEHDYRELNGKESSKLGITHFGNCYHVCQCVKCGFVHEYDSSD